MTDLDFLTQCGILPDLEWLLSLTNYSDEAQRNHILSLLRLNAMLGGGLRVNL